MNCGAGAASCWGLLYWGFSGQRPGRPGGSVAIDDDEITTGPRRWLAGGGEDPETPAFVQVPIILGVENAVVVEENVQGGGNADAAFGLWGAEAGFQQVRICGVELEAKQAGAAASPAALGSLPAEVKNAHAFTAVAPDAIFVRCALGAEVGIIKGVSEDASGGGEVIEAAGFAGGNGRGSYEMGLASRGDPVGEDGLHVFVAVDDEDVLGGEGVVNEKFQGEVCVVVLLVEGRVERAGYFIAVDGGKPGTVCNGLLAEEHQGERSCEFHRYAQVHLEYQRR